MRATWSLPVSATQTAPPPTVTPARTSVRRSNPGRTGAVRLRVDARDSAVARDSRPRRDRPPYAMADGVFPAKMVAMTCRDAGRSGTRSSRRMPTQTDPAPTATLPRAPASPTSRVKGGRIVSTPVYCGATRDTVPSRPCATQTAPKPTASPVGVASSWIVRATVRFSGSIRDQRLVVEVRHPDRVLADRHAVGPPPYGQVPNHLVRRGIDDADGVGRHQHGRVAGGDDGRAGDRGDEEERAGEEQESTSPAPAGDLCRRSGRGERCAEQVGAVALLQVERAGGRCGGALADHDLVRPG